MTDTTTNEAPTETTVAPAAPADDKKRESVAKHELIAVAGGEHVNITEAIGIRYTDKASGEKFEYIIPGAVAGTPITLLALFGAKTKATNEASRVRNGAGGDTAEQFEAIDNVFENITNGIWKEKGEAGGGSRIDKHLLAMVLIDALGDKAQGTLDTYQHRLETEEAYRKKVWSNDQIKTEYKRRAGKTGPAIDSLV